MSNPVTLPAPVAEAWDWQRDAACRGQPSSVFFSPMGERGHARRLREFRAKVFCLGCPVLEQCRSHALEADEPYGIWGGLTAAERRVLTGRPAH